MQKFQLGPSNTFFSLSGAKHKAPRMPYMRTNSSTQLLKCPVCKKQICGDILVEPLYAWCLGWWALSHLQVKLILPNIQPRRKMEYVGRSSPSSVSCFQRKIFHFSLCYIHVVPGFLLQPVSVWTEGQPLGLIQSFAIDSNPGVKKSKGYILP